MKKAKIFSVLSYGLFFLFAMLLVGSSADAVSYEYESGKVEVVSKEVVVNSFSYSYKTKGIEIFDGADNLNDDVFFSSDKIAVSMNHYKAFWPWDNDDDKTYLYKYNSVSKSFVLLDSFESGSYEFKDEGYYKVKYEFENIVEVNYIYITNDIHEISIEVDSKYNEVSAFNKFNFSLTMKDGLDLTNNKYSYSFGATDQGLQYVDIPNSELFSISTPSPDFVGPQPPTAQFEVQGKEVSIVFDSRFVSANDEDQKYFFFKVVDAAGNVKATYKSPGKYVLANSIKAAAYIVDSEGNRIEGVDKHFFKTGEVINVRVDFNTPVAYKNLQYSFGDGQTNSVNDSLEPVDSILITHTVTSDKSFVGDFKLSTKNQLDTIVEFEGENVALSVNTSGANFAVDITNPVIDIKIAGSNSGMKDYNVLVEFDEENLQTVYYYVAKCKITQSDECKDSYDEANENIKTIDFIEKEGTIRESSIIVGEDGKFNGENLVLFVKAVDKAGNASTALKYGYVVDNVIIPEDANKEEIFIFENVVDGESNVIGKKLLVVVSDAYKVNAVSYKLGEDTFECVQPGVAGSGSTTYECLKVENYDFRYDLEIKFVDELGNEELHEIEFKYTTIVDGSSVNVQFENGTADVTLHAGEKYEIEYVENNLFRSDAQVAVFTGDTFSKFEQILSLNNVPNISDLVIKVVYLNGEEEVVIADVDDNYRLPNLAELKEILGDYVDFNSCAMVKCNNLEIYLKYEYKTNNVIQERFVKIKYEDNSNKYNITNFEYEKTLEYGETYIAPTIGFVNNLNAAIDASNVTRVVEVIYVNKDGVETVVDAINTSALGKYIVRESFSHESVSSFMLEYCVSVVDTTAPTIRINGPQTIKVNLGEKFNDPSVVANDNVDKDLTVMTKVEPELDTKKEGTYVISYWVVDSSGNMSEVITRTIIVEKKNSLATYFIAGGIALVVIGLMFIVARAEFKKGKKRG